MEGPDARAIKESAASDADPPRPAARSKPRQLPGTAPLDEGDLENDNQIVMALVRGLDVLEAYRRDDEALGNAELAERTGLAKPTVSRLTYTLARKGYLDFDQRLRAYRLGARAAILGGIAKASNRVSGVALPLMKALAVGSNFNLGIGICDGRQMVYIDTCEGDSLVGLRLYRGSHLPILSSAAGRVYLAALPDAARDAALADLRAAAPARDWEGDLKTVAAAVEEYRACGYCLSIGAWHQDINGVAVPVLLDDGLPLHVLSLGGPAYALPPDRIKAELAPRLLHIAETVQRALG